MKMKIFRWMTLAAFVAATQVVFAGLEQDFDAAVKEGKPLTAEAIYLKLIKSGAQTAPIRHFQAAAVADQLGKSTMRKDRLMLYLRQEKAWKSEVEQALWHLACTGTEVEYYERLVANVKPSQTLWGVGHSMMNQLTSANRPTEVIRLADIMLSTFKEEDRRVRILDILAENANRSSGANFPDRELIAVLMKHPGLADRDVFARLYEGRRSKAFHPDFMIRYAAKHGVASDRFLSWEISLLENESFRKLTEPEKIRERDERLKNIRKLRKFCFDGKHSDSAYRYFRLANFFFPKAFYDSVSTNGYAVGAYAMYKELAGQPRCKTDDWYRLNCVIYSRNDAIQNKRFNSKETAEVVDSDPDTVHLSWLVTMSSLGDIPAACEKAKNSDPFRNLMRKFPTRANELASSYYWYFTGERDRQGDTAAVKNLILDASKNAYLSFGAIESTIDGCKAMSVAEKVALFKSAYQLSGYNDNWKEFKKRVDRTKKEDKSFYAQAEVKAFAATIKEGELPKEPLLRLGTLISRWHAKKAADMHQLVAEYKKLCPSKYRESKSSRENEMDRIFFERYFELTRRGSKDDRRKYAELVLTKMSKRGPESWGMEDSLRSVGDPELWLKYRQTQATLAGNHDPLSYMLVEKNAEKPFSGIDMKKMSPGAAYRYAYDNWCRLKSPARENILLELVASRPLNEFSAEILRTIIHTAESWSLIDGGKAVNKNLLDRYPTAKIDEAYYAKPYREIEWHAVFNSLRIARRQGKGDEAIKRFCAFVDRQSSPPRLGYYGGLLTATVYLSPEPGKGGNPYWSSILDRKAFGEILEKKFLPTAMTFPLKEAGTFDFNNSELWRRLADYQHYCRQEKTKNEAGAKAVDTYFLRVTDLILAGARTSEGLRNDASVWGWTLALERALKSGKPAALAPYARKASASLGSGCLGDERIRKLLTALQASGNNEACYLYVDAIPSNERAWLVAEAAKIRAAVASSLPGIYPVGESDPTYPLYVAADELSKKNPERAWQILQDPKNQTVFEREVLKLPPDFVMWGVEQFRMARGEKDALLIRARRIATAILAQESKVAPEVVAAMILSRAEGFRDQQNFEAAKLEYQSIRDNPTYHATTSGKKAMFRAIDLQIETGNAQGVEATLEYWLSQNDREIQAEAHYFMARLAFNRKDYDECISQLRQVFAIDYTHTAGRFLQGEWKLATNSEVDDTEVLVGKLGDRNMIKPGNQFTITVQDANLSVAGGGASIPVIVRTKPGNDEELVNLYPTSRDPSNFKGIVEVVLGKANPSNRVLEVRGDDTISYVIDPVFLKERGLPLNKPKELRVIDDAKVAMGAGAPRTEEKKTEKGVKELLEDVQSIDSGVVQKLRPGNPLYVVVKDGDCSFGGENDVVHVNVETSSGDLLEGLELKEEKPFSGIFRGKIETSLPPPRAFASDTAAGLEPGDVINVNKKREWKSLPDSQPGKWLEVDTMNSFLFSEITLDTPGIADIKAIKLVGSMGANVFALGQLPAAEPASKFGLRRQQQYQTLSPKALLALRAFSQTDRAAKPAVVSNLSFRVLQKHDRHEAQTVLYHGPFVLPEDVASLRLRLVQKSTKKDALRNLWVALAIDGEEVFSGQGCELQDLLIAPDVTPGCHRLELAVAASSRDDEFDLLWEPAGGEAQPIPADWFSQEKHPQLADFVKDRAQIVKTENGFKAVFETPVRLRSFRWEFTDVKSPAVSVTRISAKDERGETILPVASDFSCSRNNRRLEVAPGDRITLTYEDERTTSGEKKVLQRQMSSSFNDASVRFIFEEAGEREVVAYQAFRFQPGDTLVLAVSDPDCDITDEPDKIEVSIENSSGEIVKKKLSEYAPRWLNIHQDPNAGMHTGLFMGILKTCAEGNTNAPANVLRVKANDSLTVSYEDRENTDPGVPCVRTTRIFATRPAHTDLTLFDTRKTQEVDRSPEAKAKLERIRRRPGNENVQVVYRDVLVAEPMAEAVMNTTNPIPVNVSPGAIPLRVNDRARARHAGSKIMVEAVAHSERAKAQEEGRAADRVVLPLTIGGSIPTFRLTKGSETTKEAHNNGTFNGLLRLSLGPIDPNIEVPEDAPPVLSVTGSDLIDVSVLNEDGQPIVTRTLKLVSDATFGLWDSSFSAERAATHVGESFCVMVDDADRDETDEPDKIEIDVATERDGFSRKLILSETMPHSGLFTGRLRPVIFAPNETIPSVVTGGVASVEAIQAEERFAIRYGDRVVFRYRDELTLPWTPARTLMTTGSVFRGANGDVRLFSKRFTDRDTAVLVQFRLAECLFEQAKEHRKLKQPEKSAEAIDTGKFILEEALKNYPDSSHVVQGEYLLANLYQELANEQKEAKDMKKASALYQEALTRFSQILGTWPDSEYAARSQYHKAFCFEMLQDYNRAAEEYVKMTYLYPESDLVGEATIRLAQYYYSKEKRFDIAGHIYRNFQARFPQHPKAARVLFMAGSCYIKQAEIYNAEIEKCRKEKLPTPGAAVWRRKDCYKNALRIFDSLVETYHDSDPKLRAQALYWAGDVSVRDGNFKNGYRFLKRTVFEFPETEWARRARGLLLQEGEKFKGLE